MAGWKAIINVKHLFTEDEDYESVQKSMNEIASALWESGHFYEYPGLLEDMRNIPAEKTCGMEPIQFANNLINEMYNICDYKRIWVD